MSIKDITVMILLASMCLATSLSGPSGTSIREIFEQLYRLPDQEKLNSVFGRLEQRNQQLQIGRERISIDDDCKEELQEHAKPLYGIVKGLRHINKRTMHEPICHEETVEVDLTKDPEYEYKPYLYWQKRCARPSVCSIDNENVCSSMGLSCVEKNETIHLIRRRRSSSCWEIVTETVPVSCECMWNYNKLGKIPENLRRPYTH